ncbi:MAG: tol-pal system protein YbgF [Rickettsiales bacterium]|nr:tol-pal system protein YbgF [Rickettsiales bacterium]
MRLFFSVALLTLIFAVPSYAQDNSAMSDRLDRLERDLTFMQRQVYKGGAGGAIGVSAASGGQIQAQLGQLQEEMRAMRGLLEQAQFANQRQAEEFKKLSADIDYRLGELEKKQQALEQRAPSEHKAKSKASIDEEIATEEDAQLMPEGLDETTENPSAEFAEDTSDEPASYAPEEKKPEPAKSKTRFENANAHYSYAFKLMNDRKFAAAGESFEAFVKQYPKNSLLPNAYYWLGESYYVRAEFTPATENFRKGFEADPKGQKAPDNLLKLGMSLSALKRKDQACIIYKQLISKYGARAPDARIRAQREYGQLGCK